ncbi:Hypothetical predicted protein [Cloeon dipterum]|uniref:Uncharacterized protein n=1 Tax=Cloeon dipterum TaxID=197152 RepID=A0A8S1CLK8_9INSE|nr:Hypothetical predicted protein [Cloeon dipterum]
MSAFRKRRNCPRRVCIQVRRRPVLAWIAQLSASCPSGVSPCFLGVGTTDRPKAQRDEDGAWLILRCDDGHLLLSIKGLALLHGLSVRSDTYKQLSTVMKFLVALAALVAVASAGVIGTPLSTISRAPAFDSAVIQSDRIGGNFAYSTAENHAYAVSTPVIQNVQTPVAVSYSAPAIAAYAAPAYAHGYAAYAPAAAYTHGYAAGPAVLAL